MFKTRLGRGEDYLPISVKEAERSLHMFACGATGQGKTTLLENIIAQDKRWRSIVLVDPSGVLAQKAWSMKQDMYLSRDYPEIALNPMMIPNCSDQRQLLFPFNDN